MLVAFYSISLKAEKLSAEKVLKTETEHKTDREMHGIFSLLMFHANLLQLHNYNDNKHL